MILTLTREEVENIVREKFNLPDNVRVLISQYSNNSIPPLEVTVNKDNQVESIKNFVYADTDSVKFTETDKVKDDNKRLTAKEIDEVYERYAQKVEEFLSTGKDFELIDLEGRAPSTVRYRYNTAIKMYGFDDKCYASATGNGTKGHAKLVRKEKS